MNGLRYTRPLDDRLVDEDLARGRRLALIPLVLVAIAAALIVVQCGDVEDAYADDTPGPVQEPRHDRAEEIGTAPVAELLRVLVAEEGLRLTPGHGAILEVLARRSPNREITAAIACRYSAAFTRDCELATIPLERRPWLAGLEPTCEEPERWSPRLSWDRWRSGCLAVVDVVERFVAGELVVRLDRRAVHFGAPHGPDLERAIRAGWRHVPVRGAHTLFWGLR